MTTPFGRRFNLVRHATPAMIGATLCFVPGMYGQTDTGRVTGVVTDAIGQAIPGAAITLTNTDTGTAKTTASLKDGRFAFAALMRGHYRIQATSAGFAGTTQPFELEVQQVRTVAFKLVAGNDAAPVEVKDAVKAVDLSTPALGTTVTYEEVTELPLSVPNFTQLATLTPGVTRGATASDASGRNNTPNTNDFNSAETFRYSTNGGAALSSDAQRPQANSFLLDGLNNNEPMTNSIVFFTPPEAIEEFRVSTSVAPPELGGGGGATLNVSTKSGTKRVHGSGFLYYRSSAFSANPLYFSAPGTANPNLQQKTYGGSIGGPIFKNKAYLFLDYQAFRQKGVQDASFHTVPTALMRQGIFTELLGTGLTTTPSQFQTTTGCTAIATGPVVNGAIYDPTTCQQFGAAGTGGTPNVIPFARRNPAGTAYLNAFNLPNRTGILQNYYSVRRRVQNYSDGDARLDFHVTKKDSAFIRVSYAQDSLNADSTFSSLPSGSEAGATVTRPRGLVASYTRDIRPNIVNEARFGFTHYKTGYTPVFSNTPVSANLGIAGTSGLGGGALIRGGGQEIESTGDGGSYLLPEQSFQYADTITYQRKRQTFRAGVSYMQREVDYQYGNVSKGYFAIGGNPAGQPGTGRFTGYEVSELLSGFTDYEISPAQPKMYFTHNVESDFFLQDDWHLSKKMTLDLGLRYDLNTSPYENTDSQSNFDIRSQQLYLANYGGQKRALNPTDKNNFAPRVGFAYDLLGNGKTTIRGGFGMFFFVDRGGVANQLTNNAGFNGAQVFTAQGVNQPVPLVPPATAPVPSQYLNLFDGQRIGLTGMGTPNIVSTSVSGSATTTTVPALYNNNNATTRPLFQAFPSGATLAQFYAGAGTGATSFNNFTNIVPGQPFPTNPVQVGTLGTGPAGAALIANQQNNQNSTVLQYNLEVQQQLDRSTTATIAIVGSQGQHLMNWFNVANPYLGGSGATLFPLRSSVLMEGAAGGASHYAGVQAKLERNVADGLSATVAYSFSHALDNGNGAFNNGVTGAGSRVLLAQTGGAQLGLNYGNSDQDQRHVLVASALYKLPFGHGKKYLHDVPFYVDEVIGGWQINPLLQVESGTPIDFDASGSPDNRPDFVSYSRSARAQLGGGRNANNQTYFNGVFALPPTAGGTYTRVGTLSRNKFAGPGYTNLDLSAFKGFHVTDRFNLEFRAMAFNLLNHPQFSNPDTNVKDGTPDATGTVFATGIGSPLGTINSVRANTQRQLELGVHARF